MQTAEFAKTCLTPAVAALFVHFSTPAQATPFFMGLGDLPGGSVNSSLPFSSGGLSDDGLVVVGQSRSANNDFEAFRWTVETGMVGLGDLPGGVFTSRATGVSGDGSVVVGRGSSANPAASTGTKTEAFRWTQATGMVGLGDTPGGGAFSRATDVSADGTVIVGLDLAPSISGAFRWTESTGFVDVGDLPGGPFGSAAQAVNADGSVIVGDSNSANGPEAFRWTASGGIAGLGDLPGGIFQSVALGVSADGRVVVGEGHSANGQEAFRWTEETGMVGLGDLPGGVFDSFAFDTSADGSIVVGQGATADGGEAIIWDEANGLRRLTDVLEGFGLDLTGWRLFTAHGVSADGKVFAGSGINPNGSSEAWIASLRGASFPDTVSVSAPGTLGVFLFGLAGMVLCRFAAPAGAARMRRLN